MDRDPPVPRGGADGDAPNPDLLAAVERASRHMGAAGGPRKEGGRGPVLRFDASRASARRVRWLGAILALSMVAAALFWLLPARTQPPEDVEADLRWAVANVVREVEAYRVRTGALPDPERVRILVGEHVTYEPLGDVYVVTGERDRVRVLYDGTMPLEEWLAQRER